MFWEWIIWLTSDVSGGFVKSKYQAHTEGHRWWLKAVLRKGGRVRY